MSSDGSRQPYSWFGFVVVSAAVMALTASSSTPSPLYPVYQQQWGFSSVVLTVVFAVYVLALLGALLTVGSLSDHVGRKPVIIGSLLLLAASMALFVAADGVVWLMVARLVQGLAVGTATGALSAGVIDLQPNTRIGSLVNGAAPSLGLALGAAGAGLLVQFAPFPTTLVYVFSGTTALVLAMAFFFVPETSPSVGYSSRRHAVRSLLPSASVPADRRRPFLLILPSLLAAWALGGLYMSLGPSIVQSVFRIDNHLVSGLAIFTLFAAGSSAAVAMHSRSPRQVVRIGATLLVAGVVGVVVSTVIGWIALYFTFTAIAGFGWGASFLGSMSIIGSLGMPHERGRIFATTYVVCYLAFSVPAMVAGAAASKFGLTATTVGYGAVVAAMAVLAGATVMLRKPEVHDPDGGGVPLPARS